eukprot:CAMPEP_0178716532 /NCGR_PEP_ID=MMETSP0699-20121125/21354_1 /TAXON_ID=265572 /ORGANISM="Extubocellulus spinifer, Strain CCMP396" /LENGTH=388 /DNA_ID=CAMNT_0020366133 /DNA_START=401 /DNA_END=1567 /DNA_ORIENTATION=-
MTLPEDPGTFYSNKTRRPAPNRMEQAIKLSWFFLHSTVVPKDQTPAFLGNSISAMESTSAQSRVGSSAAMPTHPPVAFGGASKSSPAFIVDRGSSNSERGRDVHDTSTDHHAQYEARDEAAHTYHHAFGLSTLASTSADFLPPRHTSLLTASSHENDGDANHDGKGGHKHMPQLPTVPPSSSVHVTFAPQAASVASVQHGEYGYEITEGSEDRYNFAPSSHYYPYQQGTSYHPTQHSYGTHQGTIKDSDVTDRDVKFGRGGGTNRHPGNLYFRNLVSQARPAYLIAKKPQKGQISRQIVATIRANGGRWLKMDTRGGASRKWEDVGDDEAAKKVSQALREGLALKRRQALMASVSGKGSIAYPSYRGSPDQGKCRATRRTGKTTMVQE